MLNHFVGFWTLMMTSSLYLIPFAIAAYGICEYLDIKRLRSEMKQKKINTPK